jgi:hypothetical protein
MRGPESSKDFRVDITSESHFLALSFFPRRSSQRDILRGDEVAVKKEASNGWLARMEKLRHSASISMSFQLTRTWTGHTKDEYCVEALSARGCTRYLYSEQCTCRKRHDGCLGVWSTQYSVVVLRTLRRSGLEGRKPQLFHRPTIRICEAINFYPLLLV